MEHITYLEQSVQILNKQNQTYEVELLYGATNKLYKQSFQDGSKFLVRVFNSQKQIKDIKEEQLIFSILSSKKLAPKFYYCNDNFRIEEFIENQGTIQRQDTRKWIPIYFDKLEKLHQLQIPEIDQSTPLCKRRIKRWGEMAFKNADIQNIQNEERKQTADILLTFLKSEEYSKLLAQIYPDNLPLQFSHNDATIDNALIISENEIQLIDFEYAGYNYK